MLSQKDRDYQETIRKLQDIDLRCMRRPSRLSNIANCVPKPCNPMPDDPLPKWETIPLNQKFPIVPCPTGQFQISRSAVGESIFKCHPCYNNFDTSDPCIRHTPIKYEPLHDPNLKGYYREHPRLLRSLKRRGMIDECGKVICSVTDFNAYREYLSRIHGRCVEEERDRQEKATESDVQQFKKIKQCILREVHAQKEAAARLNVETCKARQAQRDLAAQLKEMGHASLTYREKLARERAYKAKRREYLRRQRVARITRLRNAERERHRKMVLEWHCREIYAEELRQSLLDYKNRLHQAELNEFVKNKREYQSQKLRYEKAILIRNKMEQKCGVIRRRDYYDDLEANRIHVLERKAEIKKMKQDRELYLMRKYGRIWLAIVAANRKKHTTFHDSLWNIRHHLRGLVGVLREESGAMTFTNFIQGLVKLKPGHVIEMEDETRDVIFFILNLIMERAYREYLRKSTSCAIDFFTDEARKKMSKQYSCGSKDTLEYEDFIPPTIKKRIKPLIPYEKPLWPCSGPCAGIIKGTAEEHADWKRRCAEMAQNLTDVHTEISNYLMDSMCAALEKQLCLDANSVCGKKPKKKPPCEEEEICPCDEVCEEANYFADEHMQRQQHYAAAGYRTHHYAADPSPPHISSTHGYRGGKDQEQKQFKHSRGKGQAVLASHSSHRGATRTPSSVYEGLEPPFIEKDRKSSLVAERIVSTALCLAKKSVAKMNLEEEDEVEEEAESAESTNSSDVAELLAREAICKSAAASGLPSEADEASCPSPCSAGRPLSRESSGSEGSGTSDIAERLVKVAIANSKADTAVGEDSVVAVEEATEEVSHVHFMTNESRIDPEESVALIASPVVDELLEPLVSSTEPLESTEGEATDGGEISAQRLSSGANLQEPDRVKSLPETAKSLSKALADLATELSTETLPKHAGEEEQEPFELGEAFATTNETVPQAEEEFQEPPEREEALATKNKSLAQPKEDIQDPPELGEAFATTNETVPQAEEEFQEPSEPGKALATKDKALAQPGEEFQDPPELGEAFATTNETVPQAEEEFQQPSERGKALATKDKALAQPEEEFQEPPEIVEAFAKTDETVPQAEEEFQEPSELGEGTAKAEERYPTRYGDEASKASKYPEGDKSPRGSLDEEAGLSTRPSVLSVKSSPSLDVSWVKQIIEEQRRKLQNEKDTVSSGDESAIDAVADDENLSRMSSFITRHAICKELKAFGEPCPPDDDNDDWYGEKKGPSEAALARQPHRSESSNMSLVDRIIKEQREILQTEKDAVLAGDEAEIEKLLNDCSMSRVASTMVNKSVCDELRERYAAMKKTSDPMPPMASAASSTMGMVDRIIEEERNKLLASGGYLPSSVSTVSNASQLPNNVPNNVPNNDYWPSSSTASSDVRMVDKIIEDQQKSLLEEIEMVGDTVGTLASAVDGYEVTSSQTQEGPGAPEPSGLPYLDPNEQGISPVRAEIRAHLNLIRGELDSLKAQLIGQGIIKPDLDDPDRRD